jgi:pyridoxine kinase
MDSILSIQSWVAHGFVGNRVAVFVLESAGIPVDAINTVQYSNHTQYPLVRGPVLSTEEFNAIVEGLTENGLDEKYSGILTGYNRNTEMLAQVAALVKRLKARRSDVRYYCDPVLGDVGRLYVPEDVVQVYRDTICPLADYLFPNQTEVELLLEMEHGTISSVADALAAVRAMHTRYQADFVVMTSAFFADSPEKINVIGYDHPAGEAFTIEVPARAGQYTGTGDLFASLVLTHTRHGKSFRHAVEATVATVQAVLDATEDAARDHPKLPAPELALLKARRYIEHPPSVEFHARDAKLPDAPK